MPRTPPDADALVAAFDLGTSVAPLEQIASGWGGRNLLWRCTTSDGTWAIKEVGRELSLDPEDTLALELAAYDGGVPMPRPVPTRAGRCFTALQGRRYRCHEWIHGTSLCWHAVKSEEAAVAGGVLARLHALHLPWSSRLMPQRPSPGTDRWHAIAEQARYRNQELAERVGNAFPAINHLEALAYETWSTDGMVGSHRDLTPTNIMRVDAPRRYMLVDWDTAGPVVPRQEVACFALVLADRGGGLGYASDVTCAFIRGYREAGGEFSASSAADLAMLVQGQLWWTEQNVRMAMALDGGTTQDRLAANLLGNLETIPARLSEMSTVLAACG